MVVEVGIKMEDKIVSKWLIESKDPNVKANGVILRVIRETPKAVLAVVKYPIFIAPTLKDGHKFGTDVESRITIWVPKSQINQIENNELNQIEFTSEGQI